MHYVAGFGFYCSKLSLRISFGLTFFLFRGVFHVAKGIFAGLAAGCGGLYNLIFDNDNDRMNEVLDDEDQLDNDDHFIAAGNNNPHQQ